MGSTLWSGPQMNDPFGVSKIAPRIVYHGTDAKSALKIMRRGFKANRSAQDAHDGTGAATWVSRNKEGAKTYAVYNAHYAKNKPARVKAMAVGPEKRRFGNDVERLDPKQLIPLSARPIKPRTSADKTMFEMMGTRKRK
jgi:hypothetical protein